jgi:hypothetical protein
VYGIQYVYGNVPNGSYRTTFPKIYEMLAISGIILISRNQLTMVKNISLSDSVKISIPQWIYCMSRQHKGNIRDHKRNIPGQCGNAIEISSARDRIYGTKRKKKSEPCNRNIRGIRMKNPRTQKENAKHVLEICTNPWNTKNSSARFFDSIFCHGSPLLYMGLKLQG